MVWDDVGSHGWSHLTLFGRRGSLGPQEGPVAELVAGHGNEHQSSVRSVSHEEFDRGVLV